jgi:NADH-quinone oxidoreductase subunit E
MSGQAGILDSPEQRARWEGFQWTAENARRAREFIGWYPEGRQVSAVIPLLDLAQRQVGVETQTQGWLPIPVMEFVAKELDTSYIRVLEVATFYTMFNLEPVGRYHVQLCGTTPCVLRGAEDLKKVCHKRIGEQLQVTPDGKFSWIEVECLGACVNAPMAQINYDFYEDLTADSLEDLLDQFSAGAEPKPGPQIDRIFSAPVGGPTTLTSFNSKGGTKKQGATPKPAGGGPK